MKIIRFKSIQSEASSHEDPKNPGVFKKVLLRRNDITKGRVQMINWAILKTGRFFEPHYHEDMEEIFIMVSGLVKIKVGNEEAELSGGDVVVIPEKKAHQMWNLGIDAASYIALGISKETGGKTVVLPKTKSRAVA